MIKLVVDSVRTDNECLSTDEKRAESSKYSQEKCRSVAVHASAEC